MYKLYTHNDLDGLGCAILAKLALKDDIDIEYCKGPDDLEEHLLKSYQDRSIFNYNLVYITDCSIPKDSDVFPYIAKHKNIRLYDHHQTALFLNEYPWAHVSVEFNGKLTCGTELFYNFLLEKGKITERKFFVEQVRLLDTWDWTNYTSFIPKYLSDLIFILGLSNFVISFTEKLKKKDLNELTIFNQYERDLLEYESIKQEKYITQKKNQAMIVTTDKDKKYVLSFADMNQSVLGNTLCEEIPDAECSIMFNLNSGYISIRSIGEKDSSVIAKLYSGGGHKNASGGKIDDKSMSKIVNILMEKIGNVKNIEKLI